jgi:signal transduction histidine kinase
MEIREKVVKKPPLWPFQLAPKEIDILLSQTSMKQLLESVMKLPQLKNVDYFIFAGQQKGHQFSTVYDVNKTLDAEESKISSSDFEQIFEHIKKNKKGYLFEVKKISLLLKTQGHITAQELVHKSGKYFCLCSSNELIPPENEKIQQDKLILSEILALMSKIFRKKNEEFLISVVEEARSLSPLLMEKKDEEVDVLHFQKSKILGDLFNTLKHEMSNPLFGMKLCYEVHKNQLLPAELKQIWENVALNITRSEELIDSIQHLFSGNYEQENLTIEHVLMQTLMLAKMKLIGIQVKTAISPIETIYTNKSALIHLLFNLIVNAAEELHRCKSENPSRDLVLQITCKDQVLSIADSGDGLGDYLPFLFKEYKTTKPSGTGLGLSLCLYLATRLNIQLSYMGSDFLLGGARFSLHFKEQAKS